MKTAVPPLATLRWSSLQNVITDHHYLAPTKIERLLGERGSEFPTLTKIEDCRRPPCPCSFELLLIFPSNFAIPNFRLEPDVFDGC